VARLHKPVCEPHPVPIYGQLITQEQPSKLLTLSTRVWLCAKRLTQLGLPLSTALIDRLNLMIRHALAPLVRTTASICKDWEPTPRRVVFVQALYNAPGHIGAWACPDPKVCLLRQR
jgi:hypothetical protein